MRRGLPGDHRSTSRGGHAGQAPFSFFDGRVADRAWWTLYCQDAQGKRLVHGRPQSPWRGGSLILIADPGRSHVQPPSTSRDRTRVFRHLRAIAGKKLTVQAFQIYGDPSRHRVAPLIDAQATARGREFADRVGLDNRTRRGGGCCRDRARRSDCGGGLCPAERIAGSQAEGRAVDSLCEVRREGGDWFMRECREPIPP